VKYKNWSPEIWRSIEFALKEELQANKHPVAAFDADGTLWDTDLGESFFKYQIKNKLLMGLPKRPWEHYRKWKESGDPRPAYLWLAQINQGHTLEQVRSWAEENVKDLEPLPIFEAQRSLIELLQKNKVDIFVVTASVKWAVEPGARRLGIPLDKVLGIKTQVIKGLVSDQQDGLITYREGKAEALLQASGGRLPFLSCGNTLGDLSLLEKATRVRLAVGAAPSGHELFDAEERLRHEATTRNWHTHRF
jgi:phosphoserine phosphatase